MLYNARKGFTLVELLVVMGMSMILLSIGGLSLAAVRSGSQIDLIASEVRSEMMRVQSETGNGFPSGMYFETDRYVYFEGASYTEGALTNEESTLPSGVTFSEIVFPSATVQFDNVTGNPLNFVSPYQVVVTDGSSSRTVSVNAWGVIEIDY